MYFIGCILMILTLLPLIWKKCNFNPFSKEVSNKFKGILALLIVTHHLSMYSYIHIISDFKYIGWVVVACFLFISGYGLTTSLGRQGKMYLKGFLFKRIIKILIPFILCLLLYWILSYIDGNTISLVKLLRDFIDKGDVFLPFSWYVIVILYFYLLFYLVFCFVKRISVGIIILCICSVLYVYFMDHIMHWGNWWYVSTFAFNVGMLFKYWEDKWIYLYKNYTKLLFAGLVLITFGCMVIWYYFEVSFLVAALIPVVAMFLLYYYSFPQNKLLDFMGSISYEIYLIQGIPLYFLRGNRIVISSGIVYAICVYLFTIILAYMLSCFCKWLYTRVERLN